MSSLFDLIEDFLGPIPDKKRTTANPYHQSTSLTPALENHSLQEPGGNLQGAAMSESRDLTPILEECFKGVQIDAQAKTAIIRAILLNVREFNSTSYLQQRLDLLYQHEKSYLTLIKEFKEEIKFIGSMQEELRKERSRFFSDTLKEVTKALDDAKVSDEVASQWLQELVATYTRSLDLSSSLIEEHTADTIGEIRDQAQRIVQASTNENRSEESY